MNCGTQKSKASEENKKNKSKTNSKKSKNIKPRANSSGKLKPNPSWKKIRPFQDQYQTNKKVTGN